MCARQPLSNLEPINPNVAGIDVAPHTHLVYVPTAWDLESIKSFGYFTADLYILAEWLK